MCMSDSRLDATMPVPASRSGPAQAAVEQLTAGHAAPGPVGTGFFQSEGYDVAGPPAGEC